MNFVPPGILNIAYFSRLWRNMLQKIPLSKKDKLKGLHFPDEWNKELSYFCGILIGDGGIYYRKSKNEYYIKCAGNSKDEQEFYNDIIFKMLKRIFGLTAEMRNFDYNTTYGFRIYSKALVLFLTGSLSLPYSPKYSNLSIPKKIKEDKILLIHFLRGVFDTDGSFCFKKKYQNKPYYPVIAFSSKSESFTREISATLETYGFKIAPVYNYKLIDKRTKKGYTLINRIDLNGKENFRLWLKIIGTSQPKNKKKIQKYWKE